MREEDLDQWVVHEGEDTVASLVRKRRVHMGDFRRMGKEDTNIISVRGGDEEYIKRCWLSHLGHAAGCCMVAGCIVRTRRGRGE